MQKVIETLGGDKAQMLRDLKKVVEEKTKNSPLDLFIEKDEFGQTKFILKEKVKGEGEQDIKILEYLKADSKTKQELLKKIGKIKEISEQFVMTELEESVQGFSEAQFSGNTIKNVALLNKISKNNRVYSDKALENVADLASGTKVFADHESKDRNGVARSVRDLIGKIVSARKTDGLIKGDLEILENHKEWVFSIAKQMPEVVGMSIKATGIIKAERDSQGREKVESVSTLKSIDLVSEPATTHSLFEGK